MPGSEVYENEWQQLLEMVTGANADFVIASGSLPPGVPTDIFGRISVIAKKNNANFIADTSGEALQLAVEEGVFLVKPNLGELSSLVGKGEVNHESIDEIAREFINKEKCQNIVVSMGRAGARLITMHESVQIVPPVVKKQSTVGAGDSMVAGIVYSLSIGKNLKEAVQYGVAAGTAATMNPGTELCKKEDTDKLFAIIRGH